MVAFDLVYLIRYLCNFSLLCFQFHDLVTALCVLLLRHHKYLPTVDRLGDKFNTADFNAEKRFSTIAQIPKTLRTSIFRF